MDKLFAFFGLLLVVFVVAAVISLLLAWPFMWMWNYAAVAALTVAKPITYWPAFCLMWFISLFMVRGSSSSS